MRTRMAVIVIGAVVATASTAGAHSDPNADASRCDTWYRQGHQTNGSSHDHSSGSDLPGPGGPVHSHSGHHGVRTPAGYVEVVGGQAYRGPDPAGNGFPGQGGYVQGEVDVAPGLPDADFNIAVFGPDADHPPTNGDVVRWANGAYATACIDVAGRRTSAQSREP